MVDQAVGHVRYSGLKWSESVKCMQQGGPTSSWKIYCGTMKQCEHMQRRKAFNKQFMIKKLGCDHGSCTGQEEGNGKKQQDIRKYGHQKYGTIMQDLQTQERLGSHLNSQFSFMRADGTAPSSAAGNSPQAENSRKIQKECTMICFDGPEDAEVKVEAKHKHFLNIKIHDANNPDVQ